MLSGISSRELASLSGRAGRPPAASADRAGRPRAPPAGRDGRRSAAPAGRGRARGRRLTGTAVLQYGPRSRPRSSWWTGALRLAAEPAPRGPGRRGLAGAPSAALRAGRRPRLSLPRPAGERPLVDAPGPLAASGRGARPGARPQWFRPGCDRWLAGPAVRPTGSPGPRRAILPQTIRIDGPIPRCPGSARPQTAGSRRPYRCGQPWASGPFRRNRSGRLHPAGKLRLYRSGQPWASGSLPRPRCGRFRWSRSGVPRSSGRRHRCHCVRSHRSWPGQSPGTTASGPTAPGPVSPAATAGAAPGGPGWRLAGRAGASPPGATGPVRPASRPAHVPVRLSRFPPRQ